MHDFDTISDDTILASLAGAQVIAKGERFHLHRYHSNYDRKDARRRAAFRVWAGDRVAFHLTVGLALGRLHEHADAFARENPEIACKPLFFFRDQEVDFLGQEYFGTANLEDGIAAGQIDERAWQEAVIFIQTRLTATAQPSTFPMLLTEINGIERDFVAIDWFGPLDQAFAKAAVFPAIRQGVTGLPLQTNWTNGDFVAKNILFDGQGGFRLIDCEFASRTHFGVLDWFRLQHFSNVPGSVDLAKSSGVKNWPRWLEILGWVQHVLRLNEVSLPHLVNRDYQIIAEKIVGLSESASVLTNQSMFVSAIVRAASSETRDAPSAADGRPPRADRTMVPEVALPTAQLFWQTEEGYSEEQSARQPIPVLDAWTELSFDLPALPAGNLLRFDPSDRPGALELSKIEIQIPGTGSVAGFEVELLGSADNAAPLTAAGDCLALSGPTPLRFVMFGSDPFLKLRPLPEAVAHQAARLIVNLRISPQVSEDLWREVLRQQRQSQAHSAGQEQEVHRKLVEQINKLSAAVTKANAQIGVLENERHALRDQLQALHQTAAQLEQANRDAAACLAETEARATARAVEQAEQIAHLTTQRNESSAAVTQADVQIGVLETERHALRDQLQAFQQKVAQLEQAARDAAARLAATEARAAANAAEQAEQIARLTAQHDEISAAVTQANDQIGVLENERQALRAQLRAFQQTVARLEQAGRDAAARLAATEARLSQESAEKHRVEQNLAQVWQSLDQANQFRTHVERTLEELGTAINQANQINRDFVLVPRLNNETRRTRPSRWTWWRPKAEDLGKYAPAASWKDIYFDVDSPSPAECQRSGHPVRIQGWFFDSRLQPARLIEARLGGKTVLCQPCPRKDVVEHFRPLGEIPLEVGFSAEISSEREFEYLVIEAVSQSGKRSILTQGLLGQKSADSEERKLVFPPVSLIIPTLNGGELFRLCLQAIRAQDYPADVQLLIIDSGSTDGTDRLAESFGAEVVRIKQGDFHHSRTRQMALTHARHDFVAYFVQDAVPEDARWMQNMVRALLRNPSTVACYGRQEPHPDADLYARFESTFHNRYLGDKPRLQSRPPPGVNEDYSAILYRCRFDNVCALYRRSALNDCPFPEIPFGEDMAWAKAALDRGWSVAYEPAVRVRHSHNRPPDYRRRRSFVDTVCCSRIIGLPPTRGPLLSTAAQLDELTALASRAASLDALIQQHGDLKGMTAEAIRKHLGRPTDDPAVAAWGQGMFDQIAFILAQIGAMFPNEDLAACRHSLQQAIASAHGTTLGNIYVNHAAQGSIPDWLEQAVAPLAKGV